MAPPDPILGITDNFKKDPNPQKVSLGVGAYRDDNGKPWILSCVRKAEEQMLQKNIDHEYAPIQGFDSFIKQSTILAYGNDSPAVKEERVAGIQGLSGTGCLRVGMEYFNQWQPGRGIHVPDPTWPNHRGIATRAGLQWKNYPYYDKTINNANIPKMLDYLNSIPNEEIIVLHAVAHNPTGSDPTKEEWKQILEVIKKKNHWAFFDSAYQGFASGDPQEDAYAIRLFEKEGARTLLAQSFAKNFGLYGERVGCLSVVCDNKSEAAAVKSQLKNIARPMYSNPPIHGGRVVDIILSSPELNKLWHDEVMQMADRINDMRTAFVTKVKEAGSTRDWSHITKQIGMFAYTGIEKEQCQALAKDHSIYLTMDGRISIAGLNTKNVQRTAEAFHKVTS